MLLNTYGNPRLLLTKDEALALATKLLEIVGTAGRTPSKTGSGSMLILVGDKFNEREDVKSGTLCIFVEETA